MLLPLAATLLLGFAPATPERCSVRELRDSPGYQYRVERIRDFIDSASVIVRAVAIRPEVLTPPPNASRGRFSEVSFVVTERLRGTGIADTLVLSGILVENDDFNSGPVPYTTVRRAGQRGDCFAEDYRVGAEYLFILREFQPGALTPYWKPLAPLNEQLRGPDDPWLLWVRKQVSASGR
jgi:hypothetical protein